MYLKSIEIQGFKSFANRIVLKFHNGITGIVGPNGSGKSNIGDAVRWVLGEQSAKQLRGGAMQDVIFAGTQARKPMGYAYVAITLDNADHVLPVDYNEVTVSRRLYRSGESEYMINGTQCRLRDIQELFYDTGIGKEGYSIIGQGQIEAILNGKPEQRRELFDEAAGIVKFKRRKLQAQKKLENEQQNLIRVNDILDELTRQVGPLERQAEKAKIFLKKKEELKAYDVNMFLAEFKETEENLKGAQENLANANAQLEDVKTETEKIRNLYNELQEQLDTIDGEYTELLGSISDNALQRSSMESQISLLEEQIRSAGENAQRNALRLEQIDTDVKAKEEDCARLLETEGELAKEIETLNAQGQEQASTQKALSEKLTQADADADEQKAKMIALLGQRTDLRAQQQKSETMLEQVKIRRAQLESQVLALKSQSANEETEKARLQEDCERIASELEEMNSRSTKLNERITVVQEKLTHANSQTELKQSAYHRDASRLETLRNIAERYDGYGSAIKRVMEQKDREHGLLGVVADLIRTDKKYEIAIETALGGSIQNIVTETEVTAKKMINFLKQGKLGRATFLPLTAMKQSQPFKNDDALKEKGVIGLASDLVEVESKYDGLARHLLGRTIVCDTIDHAVDLQKKFRYSLRIVTLEGESLNPGGALTGGAFKNNSNLLGRRREIEELEEKVSVAGEELDELRRTIDDCRSERNNLRQELVDLSRKLQTKYLEQNTAQMKLDEVSGRSGETKDRFADIREESRKLDEESAKLTEAKNEAAKLLSDSSKNEESLKDNGVSIHKNAEELKRQQAENQKALEQTHLRLNSATQKKNYLTGDRTRLEEEIAALKEEKQQLLRESQLAGEQTGEKTAEIEKIRASIAQTDDTATQKDDQRRELENRKEETGKRQKEVFEKREELSEQSTLLEKECLRLNSQIEKLSEKKEGRINYMWEEYELTYSSALPLQRDDLGSRTEWKKQMNTLRTQIRDLGNVNVNAIEEYKEVSERYEFLSTQHDDLIKAEKALEKVIAQLDEGMRVQFKEQFAKIQVEFDKAFKLLFGGGKGTLELVEDEDILEAGVRIVAQPPGKKLVNMMQMSGGEKALTAIALLFAIQNLKPSPFCLLDEIEAALDEVNVDRYAAYLRKLTKDTQFIIITHRRGTMAVADRLYGITMQEKGVSTLVSVSLIEGELDN